MKTIYSQPCNVEMRDPRDLKQNAQLYSLVDRVVGHAPLGVVEQGTTIYIPYQDWIDNGGCGSVVPEGVKLVHGLDAPTTDISHLRERRRRFLVSDQASAVGFVHRVHMAAHHKVDGMVRVKIDSPYCGEVGTGEGISPSLEGVTCPECLQELKRINQSH